MSALRGLRLTPEAAPWRPAGRAVPGARMTGRPAADPRLLLPSGTITDVLIAPGSPETAVYDYGVLGAGEPRALHCPCGRTDRPERAEEVIAAHLAGAPVGTQAAILVRAMAADGTTGCAYLFAVAERGEDSVVWPTYQRIPASGSGVVTDARSAGAAAPTRAGRPPDSGSTTIARTV